MDSQRESESQRIDYETFIEAGLRIGRTKRIVSGIFMLLGIVFILAAWLLSWWQLLGSEALSFGGPPGWAFSGVGAISAGIQQAEFGGILVGSMLLIGFGSFLIASGAAIWMTVLVLADRGREIAGEDSLRYFAQGIIQALILTFIAIFISGGFFLPVAPGGGLYAGIAALLLVGIPAFTYHGL